MTNLLGEFFGTLVLLSFGVGACANLTLTRSKAAGGGGGGAWIAVTAAWGFAVLLGVFSAIATGAPQADLNPAVTLAKMMVGVYTPGHAVMTMLAEVAGGFAGAVIAWLIFLPHWELTEDKASKLGCFCTIPAVRNTAANLICEALATAFLLLMIFVIFSKEVSDGGTKFAVGFGPYMVGILIWALGLSFGGPTGYALNPARDLGPRIAHAILPIAGKGDSDWGYSWIPVAGPFAGAVLSVVIGKTIGIL
ncbi:MIP/aquaporin family protein [Sporomusa acidovorans]|uniref:Glycerol uptake facilitator protein n=1 Tax=Sporomusa acidovorans (strain ATCC 49682 / DSM 3132 / Mol) TaxID=1123286 RepID=A0ABZ3IXV5_SPOA4|nr:MIP/aquaporin family protein [Sporomusa acidovorans]OZC23311.1 glycerol uptake facilitator protein [Sporomusa acidovorans DSM 3132]SDE41460.1 glycerol uptake facilitator protein [Sporomusa acidovorans]